MNDLIDIILVPHSVTNEDLVQKVAAVINQDLYHTRALLASKIPRIITQTPDIQKLEDIRQKLRDIGLAAFICKDLDLRRPLQLFRAYTLEFGVDSISFKDKNARSFVLDTQNTALIFKGMLNTAKDKEIITRVKKLNLTATLLSGGIPIRRTVQERKIETTIQLEGFIRIFEKNSADFCLELKQFSFNYASLGAEMTPSSGHNFNFLAGKIRESCPEAIFNAEYPPFSSKNLDLDSKLIYLGCQTVK